MLSAFSHPSGRPELLVTVSSDGRINLWDTATSTLRLLLVRPRHLASRWTSVAWQAPRPTGGSKSKAAAPGLLALGSDAGLIVVWDVQLGEVVHELEAHSQAVNDVLFDSDGTLLSCGEDRLVKSWSCESGKQLDTFKAGKAAVHRLALSADNTHVLLAGTTIRLMRREGWKRLQRLPGHAEPVSCLCFAPNEQFALSSADNRHLSLWHASPQVKPTEACVQTFALDSRLVQAGFLRPATSVPSPPHLAFFGLTATGRLYVWRLPLNFAPKPGDAPPLAAAPHCTVRVAAAAADGEGTADDSQRIFAAALTVEGEAVVAYGSTIRPTIATVKFTQPDGTMIKHIELPRLTDGLLAPPGGSAKKSGKRLREGGAVGSPNFSPKVQQLATVDMALPSQARFVLDAPTASTPHDEMAAEDTSVASAKFPDAGAPSFGRRLAGMGEGASAGVVAAQAAAAGGRGGGDAAGKRKPSAASQVALLIQALQNGDADMLDQVLGVQDAGTISNTVARLPITSVLPFLEAVLLRVQGKPGRVATLAGWLRAVLSQHAAYLMACPQLLPMLTPLYQCIDERLSVFKSLLKLVGRMQMLQSQMAAQAAFGRMEGANGSSGPVLTFDEEEEAVAQHDGQEEEEEEEFDDNESDDDADDDADDDDDDDDDDSILDDEDGLDF